MCFKEQTNRVKVMQWLPERCLQDKLGCLTDEERTKAEIKNEQAAN